jgi:hypothetical protein
MKLGVIRIALPSWYSSNCHQPLTSFILITNISTGTLKKSDFTTGAITCKFADVLSLAV